MQKNFGRLQEKPISHATVVMSEFLPPHLGHERTSYICFRYCDKWLSLCIQIHIKELFFRRFWTRMKADIGLFPFEVCQGFAPGSPRDPIYVSDRRTVRFGLYSEPLFTWNKPLCNLQSCTCLYKYHSDEHSLLNFREMRLAYSGNAVRISFIVWAVRV